MSLKVLGAKSTGQRLSRIQASANFRDGVFQNLLATPMGLERSSFWKTVRKFSSTRAQAMPSRALPVIKTDLKSLSYDIPAVVWFGHSSYLLKHQNKTILVDPVFSRYASPLPVLVKAFDGTEIYSAEDMPDIDLLVITHDHYDHLDYSTILALRPKVKQVVTSLGVGAHLERWGYPPELLSELDWWESLSLTASMKMTATPARHFSGRTFARNRTLWSSFVLEWDQYKFFFGGDSGYGPHFKQIGEQFGHVDLAFIECGQYSPSWPHIHAVPEQSVQASVDLNAKMMLPVHWAKFPLSFHSWTDPVLRASVAAQELGVNLTTPQIGQVQLVGGPSNLEPWWTWV